MKINGVNATVLAFMAITLVAAAFRNSPRFANNVEVRSVCLGIMILTSGIFIGFLIRGR